MWKTGHSLIKSKMKETGAPLAGEMSGHIFFKHRWYGFDDALYAAVRLIEARERERQEPDRDHGRHAARPPPRPKCASRSTKPASSPSSTRSATDSRAKAPRSTRPTASACSTDDGWWLLRASNTQDVLVARAEAKDQAGVERLMTQIDDQLAESGVQRVEAVH